MAPRRKREKNESLISSENVQKLLNMIRGAQRDSRVVNEPVFYCEMFNSYATCRDELVLQFNVRASYDAQYRLMRFSLSYQSENFILSIPIDSVNPDSFEDVIVGSITFGFFLSFLEPGKNQDYRISINSFLDAKAIEKCFMSWNDYTRQLGYSDGSGLLLFNDTEVKENLTQKNVVWYYGPSCSGKSYMGIRELQTLSAMKIAYNPCFSAEYEFDIIKLLLCYGENIALLIDDIQCDLEKSKELFRIITLYKDSFQRRGVYVFLVSWKEFYEKNVKYRDCFNAVEADTERYSYQLQSIITDTRLKEICGTNLALLNVASKIVTNTIIQDPREALFEWFVKTKTPEKLNAIYKLCVLGTYEYLVNPLNLPADITPSDFTPIKRLSGMYYAGHKEICRFVSLYIENNVELLKIGSITTHDTIILDYIQSVDPINQWSKIKQLIGEEGEDSLNNVGPIWKGLHRFEQEISYQTKKDPTWGNTPSSMYFVIKVASLLGVVSDYKTVLANFCNKFKVTKNGVEVQFDQVQTTNDFERIKEKMIEEDKSFPPDTYEFGETIDCYQAHKNWLLGLIVGLRKELEQFGYTNLYKAAEQELFLRQDPSGFWYPKRIPWITARVLIGLSQAGITVSNYKVSKGVDYLFNSLGERNYWNAHTGGWNTPYETSSLCLEAINNLKKVGSLKEDEKRKINRVTEYLLSNRSEWMKETMVVDGTATACCLLTIRGYVPELITYIQQLCENQIYSIVRENTALNLQEKQSCETTQIAWYVMSFCWDILKTNLQVYLNEFITRSLHGANAKGEKAVEKPLSIFISYSEDTKQTVKRIKRISSHLRNSGFHVLCYADEPLGTNIVKFMQNADNADIILVMGSKSYKDKALARGKYNAGSGVIFEDLILSQLFINNNMEKIIPIAFENGTSFEDSFPPPFNTNKGLLCHRVTDSFLNSLVEQIEEKQGGLRNV